VANKRVQMHPALKTEFYREYSDLSNDGLMGLHLEWSNEVDRIKRKLFEVSKEISERIEANNATTLVGETFEAKRSKGPVSLDYEKLTPLKEVLNVIDLQECWSAETMVVAPEKWNLAQLNKMARKYGDKVALPLASARIEGQSGSVHVDRIKDEPETGGEPDPETGEIK